MTLRFFLLPYLQKFHEAYPKIKITVTNGPTPETLRYMQEGRIDFGVVTSPVTGHEEVNVYPVRPIQDIFVAGYKFWEYKNRIIPLSELAEVPLESGELFELKIQKKIPERFICIVQGSHATLSSAAQKLMEMIQEDKVLESTSDKGIKE